MRFAVVRWHGFLQLLSGPMAWLRRGYRLRRTLPRLHSAIAQAYHFRRMNYNALPATIHLRRRTPVYGGAAFFWPVYSTCLLNTTTSHGSLLQTDIPPLSRYRFARLRFLPYGETVWRGCRFVSLFCLQIRATVPLFHYGTLTLAAW